ncbi:MAG TPA: radical SAM protein [Desulfosarcina sp.]|nr:radical SAM protein [Desulfosarcina sp.]
MKEPRYRYLFGPVPSRRFGRSLGIDLVPHKTCSFDCVFCQLGRTKPKTLTRKVYHPTEDVIDEVRHWLRADGEADYLTLSGSGEPTLHAAFGRVLAALRDAPFPSALLTNGSLLKHAHVREAAALADVVKISLSAWDQRSFDWVNRPHPKIVFQSFMDGLKRFREMYHGRLWLEVFLLSGINAMQRDVEKIARLVRELAPERIHLNTVARPPAEDFAAAVPGPVLEALAKRFDPPARIAAETGAHRATKAAVDDADILSMLKRRPCTIKQIETAFGLHINEVAKILGRLMRDQRIRADLRNHQVYYACLRLPF